jgi:TonB family protein
LAQTLFFARVQGGSGQQELKLDDFVAQVKTGAQATRTHIWITMANPGEAQVEAVMRLPVPPGAAVTRAVLHVGADAVEGAFIARERARVIYRGITERRRDPALIMWNGPEWIDATVFPVEKHDRRVLELEWIEPTASRDGCLWYRVPVIAHQGGKVRRPARITVDGVIVDLLGRAWLPLATQGKVGEAAVARGPGEPFGYAFAAARERKPRPTRLVLAAETSRAMPPAERKRQRAVLEQLLAALPADTGVTLLAVDWTVAAVAENVSPAEAQTALDRLDAIPSAGALDLESALLVASARARAADAHAVVFLGYGADNFGGDGLAAPLREFQRAGQTLVVVGGDATPIADAAALTGGQSLPWTNTPEAVTRVLALLQRTPADLTLDNAECFLALETVTGETRWLARFAGPEPDRLARADARDLEALWTRAHVAATAGRDTEEGVRHRVLTPLTSILVLESTADYARWGIAAPERAKDVHLGKRHGGQQTTGERFGIRAPSNNDRNARFGSIFGRDTAVGSASVNVLGGLIGDRIGEAHGTGVLGILGTDSGGGTGEGTMGLSNFGTISKAGGGGNGSGYGRGAGGLGGRWARAPEVIPGQATVRGSLDKEIIRRVIRMHANEMNYCYGQALTRHPALSGRIAVQFTIAATGQVISSVLQSSTMDNPQVENCVVQAIRRWDFPYPTDGGIVLVSYPFNFVPGEWDHVAHVVTPGVIPDMPWEISLAALRGKGELAERIAKVAAMLVAPATENPLVLAWWMVERHLRSGPPIPGACILAANLLREANQPREAGRILSEAGGVDLVATTAEFHRWSSGPDVARLNELAARQ